jgi:hypothetical protein
MAKKAGFNFFKTEGDPSDPETVIHVKSAKELGKEEDSLEKFKVGKSKDYYKNILKSKDLSGEETQKESSDWMNIMNSMEHWGF